MIHTHTHTHILKILFTFREREREEEQERNIDWLPLAHPQSGTWPATQAHADWESNWPPFDVRDTQPTESHVRVATI